MPRFAANLSTMFTELPMLERFAAAARAGFKGVEMQFPYEHSARDLAAAVREAGVEQVMFNMPPGSAAGDRGMAAVPGRAGEFEDSVDAALTYAQALGCTRLHAMAGVPRHGTDSDECRRIYLRNLRVAALTLARYDITLLIEPINTRDVPGYYLSRQKDALDIIAAVGERNVAVQMDLYHCQIMEGDLAKRIERNLARIGHIQIAGVPERHEPDDGEVNFAYLFALLDRLGYEGWIGCEYSPRNGTTQGLAWARPYGIGVGFG